MTSPGKGPERFIAGAVDLGEVKARAEARAEVEKQRQLQARGIGSTAGSSAGNNAPGGAGVPGDGSTSGAAQMTVDVTEANFENDVLKRSMQVPVIVAISSTRSPDSQDIVQNLESMARQANYKWIFANVSADTVPQIVQAFGVRAIPTVIALANGRPLDAREGQQPKEQLQGWIDQILQVIGDKLPGIPDADKASFTENEEPPSDPRLDAAEEALNNGDFDAALAAYDKIIDAEPHNAEAKAARANVSLLKRVSEVQASDDPTSELEKTFAQADQYMISSKEEDAFRVLLDLLRVSAGDQKTQVRDRLIELFTLCDPADPRVATVRREMASALF